MDDDNRSFPRNYLQDDGRGTKLDSVEGEEFAYVLRHLEEHGLPSRSIGMFVSFDGRSNCALIAGVRINRSMRPCSIASNFAVAISDIASVGITLACCRFD
jgi:hypothetical protein